MKLTQNDIKKWIEKYFPQHKSTTMETLQITKENAIKAYNAGCPDVKNSLSILFGADTFKPKSIMDRVKTFEDACGVLDITPANQVSVTIDGAMNQDAKSIQAYCKLIIIARALNEGWKPNWDNGNEKKYWPWFNMSSSGLSCSGHGCDFSYSSVGSRLCFKNRELAEYAAKQFQDIYRDYFLI